VLIEVANGLARSFKADAARIIEAFFGSNLVEVVPVDSDLFMRAFEMYKSYADKTWGLTDCISFIVMQDRDISEALTFDHHFAQAGFPSPDARKVGIITLNYRRHTPCT
jgi:predicted nucleic acid-binding protein